MTTHARQTAHSRERECSLDNDANDDPMKLTLRHTDIRIQAERVWLDALLSHAPDVRGLIIQAAPYISQLSESRENHAARHLREEGFGTLLVSMLTPYEESRDPDVRYDISLLTRRLQALLVWIDQQPRLSGLPIGLLAIDTVAAAGVRHIAREPERISAMTIRCGRADLAGAEPLRRLAVPTLVQVPGNEPELLTPEPPGLCLDGTNQSVAGNPQRQCQPDRAGHAGDRCQGSQRLVRHAYAFCASRRQRTGRCNGLTCIVSSFRQSQSCRQA